MLSEDKNLNSSKVWRELFPLREGDKVRVSNPDGDNLKFKESEGIITFVYPDTFRYQRGDRFIVVKLNSIPSEDYLERRTFRQEELTRIEEENP